MTEENQQWSSTFGFILASIGSAVGLGNIWRFPYIMGQNGGAVFLVVYLTLILTVCFIPLLTELFVGKTIKKECVQAYATINPKLKLFGWLNSVTAVIITSFYFVVGGWILHYVFLGFTNQSIPDYEQYFGQFTALPIVPSILTISFLSLCLFFVFKGVNKGIEIANKIMMPLFALILVVLVVFSLSLPNSQLGIDFMFKPDFSKFNVSMILTALGQALFTLSIGMGALLTYGSYMEKECNIVKSAYTIIFFDTLFAILAGVMIFPAVFSFGLEPTSGAGLVFITLPKIFSQIPCGNVISFFFFVLLLFAALTSGISILEVPVASFMQNFKLSRTKATILLFCIVSVLGVASSLSMGIWKDFTIFGKTIFDLFDVVSSNYLLPFNTLVLCLIVGWLMKEKIYDIFKNPVIKVIVNVSIKILIPAILCLIFLNN